MRDCTSMLKNLQHNSQMISGHSVCGGGEQLRSHCGGEFHFVALCIYWAIQAGLLTPLTFARHCLSPLAAFISGAYFLHNGRW